MSESEFPQSQPGQSVRQRLVPILAAIVLLVVLAGVVLAVASMLQNPQETETIRDIVIIFIAVESLLIGLVLILLLLQITRLTVLLQNEVKPILEATNETLNTLRGTSVFLSDKMVKPVIKANSSLAAFRRAIEFLGIGRTK
jgi:chromate transport protein ChrA